MRSTRTSHVSLAEPIHLPPPFTLVRLRESGDAFAEACRIAPKSGAGTLVLSAANTYSGVTTINAGAVAIAADAGLGSAPGAASPGKIVFGGGTLRTTATFTLAANRGIALTGAGTISTDPATTLTYGGIIAGAGSLTKTGTGTLILSGVNTYTGATTVSAGTLRLGTTNSIGSPSAKRSRSIWSTSVPSTSRSAAATSALAGTLLTWISFDPGRIPLARIASVWLVSPSRCSILALPTNVPLPCCR